MQDLPLFYLAVGELLHRLGFDASVLGAEQEVVSLEVEEGFSVHLGSIDHRNWFMLADLGGGHLPLDGPFYADVLRHNQLAAQRWLPIVALDAQDRLCCWLRLPLRNYDPASLTDAFDALIAMAKELLAGAQPLPLSVRGA
jgi:hypothetical protein